MSRNHKSKKQPYMPFESLSNNREHKYMSNGKQCTDTTANICYSMLISPAFKDLTARQRILYVYAKTQYFGAKSRPKSDFPDIEEYKRDNGRKYFYLNHFLMSDVFGLYPKSNTRDLYVDIKALIEHGFIEQVSNGKINQKRSIYTYCDKWKEWKK